MTIQDDRLRARMEPFDSFWEAPEDVAKGYRTFGQFYRHNYLCRFPPDREARVLVISCGPGYLVNLLVQEGYRNVRGIDSMVEKVRWAKQRGLPCEQARVFGYLERSETPYDVIFGEQEINHLTKNEILAFLAVCRERLAPGGRLIIHSINGATPLTGSESRAGNFDHYNSFTEHSLEQILKHEGFTDVEAFPLNLYVFYKNPLNYIARAIHELNSLFFRFHFKLVGKSARIFTKKIAAVGTWRGEGAGDGNARSRNA